MKSMFPLLLLSFSLLASFQANRKAFIKQITDLPGLRIKATQKSLLEVPLQKFKASEIEVTLTKIYFKVRSGVHDKDIKLFFKEVKEMTGTKIRSKISNPSNGVIHEAYKYVDFTIAGQFRRVLAAYQEIYGYDGFRCYYSCLPLRPIGKGVTSIQRYLSLVDHYQVQY